MKDEKLDGIICVAGGWAGGSAKSKDFLKNSELMWKQSVESSLVATKLASKFLTEGGLLVLTGAQGAINPTPGMIAYGVAKVRNAMILSGLSNFGKNTVPFDVLLRLQSISWPKAWGRKKGDYPQMLEPWQFCHRHWILQIIGNG